MSRGSIAAFASYRPPCPWDIFSCPIPPAGDGRDEVHLSDGVSYNHNGRAISAAALKALIAKKPELAAEYGATAADVDTGRATGLVFVSEREEGLETLHVALHFNNKVKVLSLADIYGRSTFGGVRMEDSGCFGGGADPCIVYVSTKKPVENHRTPWTVVYRTNLSTGETENLTPDGHYDLSPAVSPSGKKVAVANFRDNSWTGEIEHLKTDIVVMNVAARNGRQLDRARLIQDAGWPSWGSDNVIFFHRAVDEKDDPKSDRLTPHWGVYRYDIAADRTDRVTPANVEAMTPAAISETKVAVASIRQRTNQMGGARDADMFRHIEIFELGGNQQPPVKITQVLWPKADHYNPFVLHLHGGTCIGYHRATTERLLEQTGKSNVARSFNKLQSPHNDVDVFRVSGVFPTISADGLKLAFVDNEFKAVWVADGRGLRVVREWRGSNSVFSTVWNQDPGKDILYVCVGPAFSADRPLEIHAIFGASGDAPEYRKLTTGGFNNAFPSSNPEGTKIVFRSTKGAPPPPGFKYKNLYIMEDAKTGESAGLTRLTNGNWTDTHCQWSPNGAWIVFSSTRDKPDGAPMLDNFLDLGYFGVYLVNPANPTAVVRVMTSALPPLPVPGTGSAVMAGAGHVNHPMFSPDGRSIVVTADLAAVSVEPISMPMFLHSVRSYGDIFSFDIDPNDINNNKDIQRFHRVTHSRYEYATPVWTRLAIDDPRAPWKMLVAPDSGADRYKPACPYMHSDGGQSWHMTGHIVIPKRCC